MIQSVNLKRFKRFEDATFTFGGRHTVLTGPNDSGKTTVLQAIAAFSLALRTWEIQGEFKRPGGYYKKTPITRQAFSAVPLSTFDLLWLNRDYRDKLEIEIRSDAGWSIPMEFVADSTEQIYVRPGKSVAPDDLRHASLETVFVTAMSGLNSREPCMPTRRPSKASWGIPGRVRCLKIFWCRSVETPKHGMH